jgi:ABC-2 type transport system ATP-binding protein
VNLLEIDHVTKRYETKVAVKDATLNIPKGTIFGLLGPNGAGKTSLIRMIARITLPDTGQIRFAGEPLNETHQARTGYMPEERGLYKKMKVLENLEYILQLKGMKASQARQVSNDWLDRFGLKDWKNRKVNELSKGMQQKVQFIQTIAHKPELMILDEPFSGLDPLNAQLIERTLVELAAAGTTIIFSTHRMEQVEEFCQHIALIHNGEVVLNDTIQTIRQRHRKPIYRIETEETIVAAPTLPPGSTLLEQGANHLLVQLPDGTAPKALLSVLNDQYTLQGFELHLPRLREIFIDTVGRNNLTQEQTAPPVA